MLKGTDPAIRRISVPWRCSFLLQVTSYDYYIEAFDMRANIVLLSICTGIITSSFSVDLAGPSPQPVARGEAMDRSNS